MVKNSSIRLQNEIEKLSNSDPGGRLITKHHVAPWKGAIAITLVNIVSSLLLATVTKSFFPSHGVRGFLNDYPTWSFEFILHPAIVGGYIWLQYSIRTLFSELLIIEKIIQPSLCAEAITKCRDRLNSKIPFYLANLFGFFAGIITILAFTNNYNTAWLIRSDILGWSRVPIYFFIAYASTFIIYDLVVTVDTLNRLFRNDIDLKILHPDNVGGMSAIGRFVANLGFFMGAYAITLTVTAFYDINNSIPLTADYILFVYIGVYLLLIPFVFLLPLYSSHIAMKKQRDKMLLVMSKKINLLLSKIILLSPTDTSINTLISQTDRLEYATKMIANLPTWPINFSSLRKYFGLSITPLIPTFVTFVVGLLH